MGINLGDHTRPALRCSRTFGPWTGPCSPRRPDRVNVKMLVRQADRTPAPARWHPQPDGPHHRRHGCRRLSLLCADRARQKTRKGAHDPRWTDHGAVFDVRLLKRGKNGAAIAHPSQPEGTDREDCRAELCRPQSHVARPATEVTGSSQLPGTTGLPAHAPTLRGTENTRFCHSR